MKGDPDSMSLHDVLKKAEKAELQLLYRRKEETQKVNSQELSRSITCQPISIKTPETTVVVANLEYSSSSPTFSETIKKGDGSFTPSLKSERDNNDFCKKPALVFDQRRDNNNNNQSNSSNQSNFDSVNRSFQSGINQPPGPCPICHKKGHWKRDCLVLCHICKQTGYIANVCPQKQNSNLYNPSTAPRYLGGDSKKAQKSNNLN
ncbi:unnamed protein product [Didymodactylos carnosus]|uniref:CCHC-type domain-containing protein n=1 Tax=Didymodactylos carnosus TaxID=1234261 RepID=A0A8S2YPZ6_9BILA|nr:unnamed protein product [Didymodactylos carnosus]